MDDPILALIDRRLAEIGETVEISDEQRVWALMALQARAEEDDEAAKATMAAMERLFAQVARVPGSACEKP
jgi:hypothetical protein